MAMRAPTPVYEFGPFTLDSAKRLLRRDGVAVPLQPKTFDTLLSLVRHRGEVVEKEKLLTLIWPEAAVEENNLSHHISHLRRVLGEAPDGHKYIETIPKRGYSFVADVRERWDDGRDFLVAAPAGSPAGLNVAGSATGGQAAIQGGTAKTADGKAKRGGKRRLSLPILAASLAIFGLLIVMGQLQFSSRWRQPDASPAMRSIAVLPFKLLSPEQGDDYLGLGMAETLITRLNRLDQLVVRPIREVHKYAGLEQDPVAAGQELKVDAVLEGSLQWSDDRVRVTVRLVRVRDGKPVWADEFDERFTDIFAAQDLISQRMVQAVMTKLAAK